MATVSQVDPDALNSFLKEAKSNVRAKPTAKMRERRSATYAKRAREKATQETQAQRSSQHLAEIQQRSQARITERERNVALARELGEQRAQNAAMRETNVLQARQAFRQQQNSPYRPAAIAGKVGGGIAGSSPVQSVTGTLGAIVAAIAIAIILYILLTRAQGVTGTTNSILNFATALTSTDPLFSKSAPTTNNTAPAATQNPNTAAGTNKGGA